MVRKVLAVASLLLVAGVVALIALTGDGVVREPGDPPTNPIETTRAIGAGPLPGRTELENVEPAGMLEIEELEREATTVRVEGTIHLLDVDSSEIPRPTGQLTLRIGNQDGGSEERSLDVEEGAFNVELPVDLEIQPIGFTWRDRAASFDDPPGLIPMVIATCALESRPCEKSWSSSSMRSPASRFRSSG